MSHLHLPDGVLPLWLWILGYLFVFGYLFINKRSIMKVNMPLVGTFAAIMLVVMSIELPIGYHVNLAVLSGIVLGPIASVISILLSNIFLALIGHGGLTTIGLNSSVVSIEAIVGYYLFRFLLAKTGKAFVSTFIACIIALISSTVFNIGIVYSGTNDIQCSMHHDHDEEHKEGHLEESFDIKKFMAFILLAGVSGWVLEAFLSAFIVNYVNRIRPDIIKL